MKCPFCGYAESKVIDSRPTDENERIRRRRECMQCGKRFTTYEIIEDVPIIVVKKDKSREVFDRNKILKGMLRACEKRPVTVEALETAISEIETTLQSALDREVTSVRIGELIMEKLREIDEVAYVRFASVYKEFDSASAFVDEISIPHITCSMGTVRSFPFSNNTAALGASCIKRFSASVVLPLERASRVLPTVISVKIIAADSK